MSGRNESLCMSSPAFHKWEIKTQWITARFFRVANNFVGISANKTGKCKLWNIWNRLFVYLNPES